MVKRVIIGRSGAERLVDMVKQSAADSSAANTRPGGNKVLEPGEDYYWSRPDGTVHSVRDIDEELEGAKGRIEDAEQSLADSQVRLDEAEQQIQTTQSGLDVLENETLPAAVQALEQADQAAQQELATLDGKIDTAQQDLVAVGENIDQLETDLAAESDARDQLAQNVQGTFDDLDTRLGAFATDEALAPIRQALTDAQTAVQTAQGVAEAANQAANAASQAALEAAGIAESKGRVIIQETEPTGEDRKTSNIWIQPIPDDPDTEVEEKSVTYVYFESTDSWEPTTSSELAQAAQNALDAREAAQQAKQRAETAISNAAAAQSAAEAAQQTADSATLDAREAHNAAVAAAEKASEAAARAENLVADGGFEFGGDAWDLARGSVVTVGDPPREGEKALRTEPITSTGPEFAIASPPAAGPLSRSITAVPGERYALDFDIRVVSGTADSAAVVGGRGFFTGPSNNNAWPSFTISPAEVTPGEWVHVSGAWNIREGDTQTGMQLWGRGVVTDLVVEYDNVRLRNVTEAYALEQAAEAAQARADEAYDEAAKKLDESQVDAKITASANGKNSITRANYDPNTGGVVVGDLWVRVDANGDAFRQWYWDGNSWEPSLIKNELMESLDVHKLQVTGSAEMDSAVIDKLWVDGLAGKTATFNRLTIAPGNLFPDPYFQQPDMWEAVGSGVVESLSPESMPHGSAIELKPRPGGATYTYFGGIDSRHVQIEAGAEYRIRVMSRFGGNGGASALTHFRLYLRGDRADGSAVEVWAQIDRESHNSFSYGWSEATITAPADLHSLATVGLWVPEPSNDGSTGWPAVMIGGFELVRKAGAVLIENGAIGADQIRADEVGAEVGEFVEAEVGNLKATKGTVGEAVIDKIWADGIAAKAITTASLTVAPGNLISNGTFERGKEGWHWINASVEEVSDAPAGGSKVLRSNPTSGSGQHGWGYPLVGGPHVFGGIEGIDVEPGERFRVTASIRLVSGTISSGNFGIRGCDSADTGTRSWPFNARASAAQLSSGDWVDIEGTFIVGLGKNKFGIQTFGEGTLSDAVLEYDNVRLVRMVGAVQIDDGAVTTPKLTVTGDMSAAIVNAMTTNTKKLVVTEEAILNHATLIGQTVVDDINVQGKLIGTGGVFTGTVDFANINVTGEVLADKISGERLYGTMIEGGMIYTTYAGNGQVILSDEGYVDSGSQASFPGIRILPPDTSELVTPPGMGPNENGMIITGGRNTSGGRGFSIYSPNSAQIRFVKGTASSNIAVSDGWAWLRTGNSSGGEASIQASATQATVEAKDDSGARGTVLANPNYARIQSELGSGTRRVEVTSDAARLYARDPLGSQSLVEAKVEALQIRRVNADNQVTCAVELGQRESRMYAADYSHTMRGSMSVNDTGAYIKSGLGQGISLNSSGTVVSGSFAIPDAPTTSSPASVRYQGSTGILYQVTSSRRYKKNIVDWAPSAESVLSLRPRQWQHDDPNFPDDIDERWHVGFVAEEVHDLGLKGLVDYTGDGAGGWRPQSLNYDRFAAAQQIVLQKHEAEIIELRERIALLESQIGTQ